MSQSSIFNLFRKGQEYMSVWPLRKELAPLFPENRYIKATQFAIRVMPAVAVIAVLTQMAFDNYQALPQSMVIAFFALSMPLQGLFWLGKRSETRLPPSLAGWYRELHEKIISEGHALQPLKAQPRYRELAMVLNRAFKQLDDSSLERWF
ncbi:terminus macrodomain insulation protein YfbV [Thaumasiovibrio subtropicus]|uniref:terminus macrodomain insulation protein YfbV n=1 Tax=Thaumasiovibrio subtropicus TaxID=1891207 RepID=UPI000B35FD89|nr:terminus macrodomain insulation protein YfbV [Thaumasiovibrio subtropicus]